jgi:hypothetical protein
MKWRKTAMARDQNPNRPLGRGPMTIGEAEKMQATALARGEIVQYRYPDASGRLITEYLGDPMAWMSRFMPQVRMRQPPQWHTAAPQRHGR